MNVQKIQKDVAAYSNEAKKSFSRQEYSNSLILYKKALKLCCQDDTLVEERELTSSNCAKVCLRLQRYDEALNYASECIRLNPKSHKGYRVRAEALMKALESPQYTVKASLGYADVIQDYVHSHQLKQNATAFCEAILLAENHGHSHLVVPVLQMQDREICKELFQKLLLRREAATKHFKLVINFTPAFDASQVDLSELLKKQFTDRNSMKTLLGMGMKVKKVDIEAAVKLLPESDIDTLNLLISKCSSSDFDEACKEAIYANKFRFAACLGVMASNPLAIVNGSSRISPEEKIDLICLFLDQGADCTLLSNPLHVATQLAVETGGDTRAIRAIVKAPAFIESVPKDGRIVDSNKQTPIHLAVRSVKKIVSRKVLHALAVSQIPINPFVKDKRGKQAKDYINKEDSRNVDLENAAKIFQSLSGATKMGKKKEASNSSPLDTSELNATRDNTSSQSKQPTDLTSIEEEPTVPQSKAESNIPERKEESDRTDSTTSNIPEVKEPEDEVSDLHDELNVPSSKEELEEKLCIPPQKEESGTPQESNMPDGRSSGGSSTTASIQNLSKGDYEQLQLQELAKQLHRVYANHAEYFTVPPIQRSEGDRSYVQKQSLSKETTLESASPTQAKHSESEENTDFSQSSALLHNYGQVKEDSYLMSPRGCHKQPTHSHEPNLPTNRTPKNQSSCGNQTAGDLQQFETGDNETKDPNTERELSALKDLPWEVEATDKVVKFFKNKKIPHWLHELAMQKIIMLANGDWHSQQVCKELLSLQAIQLVLYETHLTKSARILWEVTKQFSSRCTKKPTCSSDKVIHIYSEVIRIWDIVLDHDQLNTCIKHISKSHERGCNASLQPLLVPSKKHVSPINRLPRQFCLCSDLEGVNEDVSIHPPFIPAGCTNEHEHNVITFYHISDTLLESMLKGKDARRDFPIKEWPGEFDIIEMPYDQESILLLGRSGTGKTTCCLYRLWNHFQTYWSRAAIAGPLLSRKPPTCEFSPKDLSCSADVPQKDVSFDSDTEVENTTNISEDALASNDEQSSTAEIPEHLHLVFISKNYVLSAQMKKRFYDLAAADPIFESHIPYEDKPLPNSLMDIEDFAYPLFLTARQFFSLLDNSLRSGKPFFPRAEDGSLDVKILSSDYDHENPDTLLDLIEESDDEDDELDDYDVQEHAPQKKQLQLQEWKEVTASFFERQIWPDISKKSTHNCREIDPLLVWMEIKSFIKGSRQAIKSDQGFLTEDEYEDLGKKMAPNFPGNRSEIYELFKLYKNFLQRERHQLFDECDFIHSIHTRLKSTENLNWSIHNFYVDEVQDFTQAELSVLLRVCRNPNGVFLTGDTAQSIMRGVSFRFDDLRSLFHELNETAKQSKAGISIKVPSVRQLRINFRSHTGILQLAASIIDLLIHFFPSSFDRLPEDKGMFPGPIPILLHSCNVSDLAVLLRGNKREASSIEFGAHQVIIVRSEDAKKALPDILKAGIVLTVFEAKGLEFDDVLLYDFFADSKVSKEWRVVTSFIGLEKSAAMIQERTPAFESQPRPLDFSERQHKSLNSELKYLYTAVTRAKCNLWIYDSDEAQRLPVFDYWHKRGLVKVIQINDISKEAESGVFVTSSTKEEWKERGDYFKKKRLWEPAKKCYKKAGDTLLEMESEAYSLVQQAREHKGMRKEMQDLYLKAALAFLKCDELHHDVKLLSLVAICMKNAKRYGDAAKLFEKLGQHDKARRGFMKSKDLDGLANLKEKEGDYSGAVQVFIDNNRRIEALKRSAAYERKRIPLDESVRVEQMAIKFAKAYAKQKDVKRLEIVLEYVQDASQRIKFLKDACLYSKASSLHIREHQFTEAYRIFLAQAMYNEGIILAEKQKNLKMRAEFIFQAAVAHIGGSACTVTDQEVIKMLKELSRCKEADSKARAYLLLGKLRADTGFCREAIKVYKQTRNAIGEVESFNTLLEVSNPKPKPEDGAFITMAVSACKAAKAIIGAVDNQQSPTPSMDRCMVQVDDLYCLQKHRQHDVDVYTVPSNQGIWVKGLTSSDLDPDGMIRIEISKALELIKSHMESYISKWTEKDFKVDIALQTRMQCFQFHKVLERGGYLQESFLTYTPERLHEYLRACLHALEFTAFSKHISETTLQTVLLNVFSPQATVFLPVRQSHFATVRASKAACDLFSSIAAERIAAQKEQLDNWLDIWRIHCILGKGTKKLDSIMAEKARQVNTKAHQIPHTFVFNSADKKYVHVFSMWLKACSLVNKEKKIIVSSRIIVECFLQIIARRKSLRPTISVINFVNIACIFSTALLAVTSQCCQLLNQTVAIVIPSTFLHIVKFFDSLTCQEPHNTWLLKACVEEVKRNERANLQQRALGFLTKILDVLVGKFNPHFNVLRYALRGNTLENGEAQHCLILILTLFGNLMYAGVPSREQVVEYQQIVFASLQQLSRIPPSHASPAIQHLQRANALLFTSANSVAGVFHTIHHLLSVSDRDAHFVRFAVVRKDGKLSKIETPRCSIQQILAPFQIPSPPLQSPVVSPQQLPFPPTIPPHIPIAMPAQAQIAPSQQPPMQLSYASVAGPQTQPLPWNPQALSVSPSYPAGATLVDHASSNKSETQMVAASETLSNTVRPEGVRPEGVRPEGVWPEGVWPEGVRPEGVRTEGVRPESVRPEGVRPDGVRPEGVRPEGVRPEVVIVSQALGGQSEGEPLAGHQLLSSSSGVTIPKYNRQASYTDVDETELEDPEADAPAMDPEIQEALASTDDVDREEPHETLIQETDDHTWSLVDEGVCKVCGVPLSIPVSIETESDVVDQSSEVFEGEDAAVTLETRESHIESEKHKIMERQYKVFSQNIKWLYNEYKESLLTELKECEKLDDPPPYLEALINKIQEEMNSNDQKVENYKRSCEWREGASEIENRMVVAMNSLIKQAKRERRRAITERAEKQFMKHQHIKIQQPVADDELAEADFEKEEIIEYSASTVEEEKQKERKKKRLRKNKRKK